jgi:hypothetical protein
MEGYVKNEGSASRSYAILLGVSAVFALAAISTLLPWAGASWKNVIGYKSLCSFAPISTAICAMLAAVTCTARARLSGLRRGKGKSWALPIAISLALIVVVGISIPPYSAAKADARSGASLSESE